MVVIFVDEVVTVALVEDVDGIVIPVIEVLVVMMVKGAIVVVANEPEK